MTKKTKKLVWAMAVLLLLVCACASASAGQTLSGSVSKTANCGLDLAIIAPSDANLRPGDVLELSANKISTDLEYTWSIVPEQFMDKFSEQKVNKISFKVPEYDGVLKITLHVEVRESCEETANHEIEVNVPLNTRIVEEKTAVETEVTNTPTNTATLIPTPEPIVEPTEEPTLRPSPTPESTTIAAVIPQPTSSPPLPTSTSITAPVITRLDILPGDAIVVEWYWLGELSPTQNFAVRFWSVDDPRPEARFSIVWTKELSYEFGINNVDFPLGTYYINVAVMEGASDGVHYSIAESEDLQITISPRPPTETPPSLP